MRTTCFNSDLFVKATVITYFEITIIFQVQLQIQLFCTHCVFPWPVTRLPGVNMYLLPEDTLLEMQFPEVSDITNYPESASSFVPGFPTGTKWPFSMFTLCEEQHQRSSPPHGTKLTKYTIPSYNVISDTKFYLYFRMWPWCCCL